MRTPSPDDMLHAADQERKRRMEEGMMTKCPSCGGPRGALTTGDDYCSRCVGTVNQRETIPEPTKVDLGWVLPVIYKFKGFNVDITRSLVRRCAAAESRVAELERERGQACRALESSRDDNRELREQLERAKKKAIEFTCPDCEWTGAVNIYVVLDEIEGESK